MAVDNSFFILICRQYIKAFGVNVAFKEMLNDSTD